ncbi:glycosyltransferase WbuB, partial [Achromobacter sp. Marseille-Q0513]|nr:glycosyltransferase WbuB [Achromobacter sp. Marseille-Q0513]
MSFVWNGLRHFPRQAKGKSFDVVFVFSLSPITAAIPAIYLKWRLRKPMAMWVLDLWPESLSATGFIKNKFVLGAIGMMVRWIYSCAGLIMVQSRAFIDAISRYADPAKLVYYPNCSRDTPTALPVDTQVPRALLDELESHF